MSVALKHEKFTYRDYMQLPDEPRVELIRGDFLMCAAPNLQHQRSSGTLFVHLWEWVQNRLLGEVFSAPTDVVLSNENVVQPDILFVSAEKMKTVGELNIQVAPDLVVEILSPSHEGRDRILKKSVYEEFGVSEYWVVDPKRQTVTVMVREKKKLQTKKVYSHKQTVKSTLLEGFEIPLARLFTSAKRPKHSKRLL